MKEKNYFAMSAGILLEEEAWAAALRGQEYLHRDVIGRVKCPDNGSKE